MTSQAPPFQTPGRSSDDLVASLLGPAFLALAAWFLFNPDVTGIPQAIPARVDPAQVTTQPLRRPLDDPPSIEAGGFRLRCSECHRLFRSPVQASKRLMQHRDVILDHGLNDRCFGCHDRGNRERLALGSGDTLPFSEAPRLCAECHGTTYRDWQRGTHGKTTGYWNPALGAQKRLSCIECHDPHAPAFAAMVPLPGPQTLRMGTPHGAGAEGVRRHDPLRPRAPASAGEEGRP